LKKEERKRGLSVVIFIIIFIVATFYVGYKYFRVAKIEIQGNKDIETAVIIANSGIKIDDNLFSISQNKVKNNINANSYLEYFDLKRVYPSKVIIEVYERAPVAEIVSDNKRFYIDKDVNVLEIVDADQQFYLQIVGLFVKSEKTGQRLSLENDYELEAVADIVGDINFDLIKEHVTLIDLTDVNDIMMKTKQGFVIKFGQSDDVGKKAEWIDAVIVKLAENKIVDGVINVSSGNSATYSKK
jgi:cell division protein FtsQ